LSGLPQNALDHAGAIAMPLIIDRSGRKNPSTRNDLSIP